MQSSYWKSCQRQSRTVGSGRTPTCLPPSGTPLLGSMGWAMSCRCRRSPDAAPRHLNSNPDLAAG
eukprot:6451160-Alexandrium_andersonii.AAC.1